MRSALSSFSSGDGLASQVGALTMLKTTATETARRRMDMRIIFTLLVSPRNYSGKRVLRYVNFGRVSLGRPGAKKVGATTVEKVGWRSAVVL